MKFKAIEKLIEHGKSYKYDSPIVYELAIEAEQELEGFVETLPNVCKNNKK